MSLLFCEFVVSESMDWRLMMMDIDGMMMKVLKIGGGM
jgi:hypothetical protein